MGQKGLELAFLAKNNCFQRIFSLAELGVPHPITENHSAQNNLAELGPPPLTEKIC